MSYRLNGVYIYGISNRCPLNGENGENHMILDFAYNGEFGYCPSCINCNLCYDEEGYNPTCINASPIPTHPQHCGNYDPRRRLTCADYTKRIVTI